jgi:hypothetical protein
MKVNIALPPVTNDRATGAGLRTRRPESRGDSLPPCIRRARLTRDISAEIGHESKCFTKLQIAEYGDSESVDDWAYKPCPLRNGPSGAAGETAANTTNRSGLED